MQCRPLRLKAASSETCLILLTKKWWICLYRSGTAKPGAFEKRTKGSGTDTVVNPWINLIACTTPAWIAGNFPEYMIGGGFTSRCIFVYADKKAKYVAYPGLNVPKNLAEMGQKLIDDLAQISTMAGEYRMTKRSCGMG
jgi:hypothetical protein